MNKNRIFAIIMLFVLPGCNFDILQNLKPGRSVTMDDVTYDDYTISCEVSRNPVNKVYVIGGPGDDFSIYDEAWHNLSKTRTKWTMRRARITGKAYSRSGYTLNVIVGQAFQDGERYQAEAWVEFRNKNVMNNRDQELLDASKLVIEGRITYIAHSSRVHLDDAIIKEVK